LADTIKFKCTSCEKKIGVRAEYAGKKVRCPGCKTAMRVPSPRPKRSATGTPITARSSSSSSELSGSGMSLADLAAMEERAQGEIKELSAKAASQPSSQRVAGGKECPSCEASIKPDAVICVHCGHNFDSGKKLKTKKDSKLGKAARSVASSIGDDDDGPDDTWKYAAPTGLFVALTIACYTGLIGVLDGIPLEIIQNAVEMYKDDGGVTSGTLFLVFALICGGIWFFMKQGWRRFMR